MKCARSVLGAEYGKTGQAGQADEAIQLAAKLLREGCLVAFPTETVYGLGANAWDYDAVEKIFLAKGRPSDNPLIVHFAKVEDIAWVADCDRMTTVIRERLQRLADAFWPGPLTCIVPANRRVAANVTAGLDTVGVRVPDHPVALAILQTASVPVAAPSANLSGKPSPTLAEHVVHDLQGKIPLVIDGGAADVGVESTVLDICSEVPMILRPGGVSLEQLRAVLGQVSVDPAVDTTDVIDATDGIAVVPRSPGMKYRHYAPEAKVFVFFEQSVHRVIEMLGTLPPNCRIALICSEQSYAAHFKGAGVAIQFLITHKQSSELVAQKLYDWLRQIDQQSLQVVFVEAISTDGVGDAVMNRMLKAAGGSVL